MINLSEKFTSHFKNVLKKAQILADDFHHPSIEAGFLIYGLLTEKGSVASEVLNKKKITKMQVKKIISENVSIKKQKATKISWELSEITKKIITKSVLSAYKNKHQYVGTEHMLTAMLEVNDIVLEKIFRSLKIDRKNLSDYLKTILGNTSRFYDLTKVFNAVQASENDTNRSAAMLDLFCTNLNDPQIQKNIDPVIGREPELERLIQILSRRTKNNPILLGDTGVGKTAIVEGLAKKITQGNVPNILLEKIIYNLDLGLILAGTIYRGEFESRLKQLLEEVQSNPNIILFIDEVHTLIGAGSAQGSLDAANVLKPALAKGWLRCIGATTPEEYKKSIESDPALERRFQAIQVYQPTPGESKQILQGLQKNYGNYHGVEITAEAIEASVDLSIRYLPERSLPDKAIDLIDEAAARVKIQQPLDPTFNKIKTLEKNLAHIIQAKEQSITNEDFRQALSIKKDEEKILMQLLKIKEQQKKSPQSTFKKIVAKDIQRAISQMTGIPKSQITTSKNNKLISLEKTLSRQIIGQKQAINEIASSIRQAHAGLNSPNRPLASFIFLGPSGVGKTLTAQVIAEKIFSDPEALIKIDMSEFQEKFNVSKLIGAPAGYVGYKESNKFTDLIKRRPYSVVLFDEIEKAHPDIFNLLLQILEDGILTDATGKKINFKNTIIIMTSNIGLDSFNKKAKIGFEDGKTDSTQYQEIKKYILKSLQKKFLPEFINRIDKILTFEPLSLPALKKITDLQLQELDSRVREQNMQLNWDKKILTLLATHNLNPEQGARSIRKNIQTLINEPLAIELLSGKFTSNDKIKIKEKKNQIIFSK